jgi:hypothetical protein
MKMGLDFMKNTGMKKRENPDHGMRDWDVDSDCGRDDDHDSNTDENDDDDD